MSRRSSYFNPPSPCGEGPNVKSVIDNLRKFQSTLPVRGRTLTFLVLLLHALISIHPPRAGRDTKKSLYSFRLLVFQSTLPVRGGTTTWRSCQSQIQFQSTLPVQGGTGSSSNWQSTSYFNPPSPCGEGLSAMPVLDYSQDISIHPPRAGRDHLDFEGPLVRQISIHPPRAGRDATSLILNTLPLWYFNPPSPCGEGLHRHLLLLLKISIHPPRAGRDSRQLQCDSRVDYFNPPSPCGEGLNPGRPDEGSGLISIHPPRAGRDCLLFLIWSESHISIHPPRTGRDSTAVCFRSWRVFQSTLPVRGGTPLHRPAAAGRAISIHPPRAGRDCLNHVSNRPDPISIHPPRAGRDQVLQFVDKLVLISIHPPRAGRDDDALCDSA